MKFRHRRSAALAAPALAVLLALAGCGERPQGDTAGQSLESAVGRTSEATADGRQRAREATVGAANSAKNATQDARTSVMGAGADARQAANGAAQAGGAKVDDAQITSRVAASLMGDRELANVRVDVDTRDGVVTLSGPVPSSSIKARANEIAQAVRDVKSVNNQLTVSAS